MRKYYGVAGTRGYGVYNNWYQARNARRHTPHYKVKTVDGNPLIDRAYQLVLSA